MVLASASRIRSRLLEGAGIDHVCDPAAIDKGPLKRAYLSTGAAGAADALAEAKAGAVSKRHPHALVIAADQILECGGDWLDKPADKRQAAAHLRKLRGRSHSLVSAVCAMRNGRRLWRHVDTARLIMRSFDDAFISNYLERAGAEALDSVGVYRLEGLGAQLFERIEGDYFTVLGLPLLPLLSFLRRQGVIE